ncbi:DUF3575 domain-containing protein [Flaviramulus sp. BrNp1-15]|uniref:DUF3575 domain-containing protein n=1 Tax=Flaviramulus sp. BrNp1-15 TaxID=2916754 RepID=UPI001EE7A48F|nr:DUF3575 domain-containing protein [Flaviramulus sp. BrNp1-15]ULC58214.1 DUF3575 domain-containing protein [Flaviramulus sp. BrNp1-15]
MIDKLLSISKKYLVLGLLIVFPFITLSQTSIKGNALTALIAVPNFGAEFTIGEKTTFQVDAAASFWTIDGVPMKFILLFPEFRYYTKESGYGFFFGAHIGGGKYKLQKPQYFDTDYYQDGYSLFYGMTIGYQFILNERLNLELFLGGGSQQAYYKGYSLETGEREDGATNYNKSGEFLPYRGGLMLVYKLK